MRDSKGQYIVEGATATFTEKPEARDYVLKHYRDRSLRQLSQETGVKYQSVASFLKSKGLTANRFREKRTNLEPFLALEGINLGYFAGLLDGEGTLTYQLNRNRYIRPTMIVSNTSFFLKEWLEGLGFYSVLQKNGLGRHYWAIQQSGWHLRPILEHMLPHLIVKREVCWLLLELCKLREQQRKQDPPTPSMLLLCEDIRRLNKRGFKFEQEEARFLSST